MSTQLINLLSAVKQYSLDKREYMITLFSDQKAKLIEKLYSEGFLQSFFLVTLNNKVYIKIILRYFFNKSILSNLKIISTSSRVLSLTYSQLIKISERRFIFFIKTNMGLLTLNECKKQKLGGIVSFIC